ncbi:MAG: hypothetical protein ACI3XQ_03295 [Eubacteriales bacterium]
MLKKLICVILALLSAVLVLASCKTEKATQNGNTVSTESTTGGEEDINPNLAPIDGAGRSIKILTRESGVSANYWYDEITPEDQSHSNVVDKAVYERNLRVAQKYNVTIDKTMINYNKISDTINVQISSMASDDESYHIVLPMLVHAFNMANNGYCYPIDELEFVNPEKPYWMGDIYKATTIGNKNYFISGDITTSVYGSSWVTFFNENIVEEYNIENPYDIVKKGDWTIDKMLELCKNFGGDNGDGIFDTSDNYAICSGNWVWQCFFYGSDLRFIDKDNRDIPYITSSDATKSEKLQDVLTRIVEIMNNSSLAINANKAGLGSKPSELFCKGQVLFYLANINNAFVSNDIKDMEDEYGVLPLPKYNEEQEYYSNAVHPHHSSTVIVPLNISNDHLTLISSVLEDLAYYSYEYVKPAYYDTVITYRSVRNEESFEMMEYIFEHYDIDFGLIMTDTFGFDAEVRNKIVNNDTGFSSYLSSNTSLWKYGLDNVIKNYGVAK